MKENANSNITHQDVFPVQMKKTLQKANKETDKISRV